jgi:TrmH family RNA methyltransferase
MITSRQNPKIQWVKALQKRSRNRHEARAFVVEGVRLVEEALTSGWEIQLGLFGEQLDERGRRVVDELATRAVPLEQVSNEVMQAASDTQSPQGLLLVVSMADAALPEQAELALIPDGIRDPGNLGTLLRTAAAAGVSVVFLPPGNADIYAPKVVRSAMGAHFRLPCFTTAWEEIESFLQEKKLRVYLAESGGGQPYTRVDWGAPLALVIGGEAQGAGSRARNLPHTLVTIPMAAGSESLNAAAAAAILLFEWRSQRQNNSLHVHSG